VSRADRYTDAIGATLRRQYERGTSPRDLAEEHDISPTTARSWLLRAGTEMRPAVRPGGRAAPSAPRFNPASQPTRSAGFGARPIRTHCKLCLHAILTEDVALWRSSTPLGLVHAYCQGGDQQG
jgi:hypothetical protein